MPRLLIYEQVAGKVEACCPNNNLKAGWTFNLCLFGIFWDFLGFQQADLLPSYKAYPWLGNWLCHCHIRIWQWRAILESVKSVRAVGTHFSSWVTLLSSSKYFWKGLLRFSPRKGADFFPSWTVCKLSLHQLQTNSWMSHILLSFSSPSKWCLSVSQWVSESVSQWVNESVS